MTARAKVPAPAKSLAAVAVAVTDADEDDVNIGCQMRLRALVNQLVSCFLSRLRIESLLPPRSYRRRRQPGAVAAATARCHLRIDLTRGRCRRIVS